RAQDRFGFQANNYLGSTQQLNLWSDDWVEFFMVKRLKYQLELAVQNGFSLLSRSGERVLQNIRSQINREARPSLIHGDLWSGNYIVGLNHEPYLIDPAPYWADREAEFGILTMFGGFDSDFFSAYQECYPLDSGFEDRLPIYQLYHYLNHLNLFGASYWGACQKILKHYS
ncbi:MAG: fructosamine kinase family protein, partial [Planctomycetota bacterium]|nr:fructosamine kinase family protein [Planctomycetota bacterium]